jgi:glycosyltransferase involved in cell wall biosynthesis
VKICILSVQVPFITGGAELHAQALKNELIARGCEAEIVLIPFKWYPPERLLQSMLMARLMDVEEVNGMKIDRVIALKFPAYFAPHSNKVCWILHQHRQAYDLYGTPLSDLGQSPTGRAVAAEIRRWDDFFLPQSRALYANSKTVAERLRRFNNIAAKPLYHPPYRAETFTTAGWDDYILYPGRFDFTKRQHLLFEALSTVPDHIQVVFCGDSHSTYGAELLGKIRQSPCRARVKVMGRVSEEEKVNLYANCLAVYNGVLDEDYGYITLEAFCSGKPVITHVDSGGPLEFVIDGYNGYITEPDATELATRITRLAENRSHARQLGENGRATIQTHNITWDNVIENLLA